MRIDFWLDFLPPVGHGKVHNKSVELSTKLSLLANYLLGYNLNAGVMVNTRLPPSCNSAINWQVKITWLKALHSYCVPCHALLVVGSPTKNQFS